MNYSRKASIFVCLPVLALLIIGCGSNSSSDDLDYARYSTEYNPEVDSWLQIDPDDEDVEITWWVDTTSWDFYHVADLIKKRTGVTVKFERALTANGTELSTMIAGTMKDVITITDYSTRVQLAEENYVYSIDRLAESYAPSLLNRISEEQRNFYSGSDGHIYGLANNFYNDDDVEEYNNTGNSILPNYGIVVRKDMLNAYLEYKREQNPAFDEDIEVTTPQGFIDMCLWVKNRYELSNSNPTVTLSEFLVKASNGSISTALSALMEYFSVPEENDEGDLIYKYATEEFQEVLAFLNNLYNNKLIISGNFSFGSSNIISHIKNGRPFAVIGALQNYSTGFAGYSAAGYNADTKMFSDSHEYVPIVITNSRREAPLLGDLSGRGLRVSMITKDAKREDRIIKVFDYLMSEQGQRECYYGENEGEYYDFVVRPGETRTISVNGQDVEHTYTYGQIEWTDTAKSMLGASSGQQWYNAKIKQISLLQNPLYVSLTSLNGAEMDTYQFYVRYNQKCALIPYTYSKLGFKYNTDTSDKTLYNSMVDLQASLEEAWIKALPQLIMKPNVDSMMVLYNDTMAKVRNLGYERWLAFENNSFLQEKQKANIEFAFPLNIPSYVAPEIRLKGFYDQYKKEMPAYISISE